MNENHIMYSSTLLPRESRLPFNIRRRSSNLTLQVVPFDLAELIFCDSHRRTII